MYAGVVSYLIIYFLSGQSVKSASCCKNQRQDPCLFFPHSSVLLKYKYA